ncbi:phosphate acetyltransferase [Corynebacterium casei]|uniref:phosphate acetyltransferase n=1 Tax=Corynebacterium casei TaxID=160386 RepID=UPI003F92E3AB
MPETRSALLSALGLSFEEIDTAALVAEAGVPLMRLADAPPKVAEIVAAQPLADGPKLVEGSGDSHFDAVVAAALGVPLVIIARDHGRAAMLAERHAKDVHATVAGVFTPEQLADVPALLRAINLNVQPVMSAPVFEHNLLAQAKSIGAHVVLPEGEDDRILLAAGALLDKGVVRLTILGDPEDLESRASQLGVDLHDATLLDHTRSPLLEEFAAEFAELRKSKGVTLEQARETMKDISYFATMMVHRGLADGMVSGAAHTTAHTIKPSFQIIKTVPEASVVSSIFLMVMRGRLWAFGDCAVNPNPTAEQLGEIAVVSARTAKQFGIDPRVAMLSYSTGSSGAGQDVERAVVAVEVAKALDPELKVDGPLQFDAACDPSVAAKKMPGSEVAGHANVFIFPDLEAGNIGYKTAQRTGNALAVGPILQGLNKPVNDLSRGATVPDIINTVAITAIQVGGQ